MNHAASVVGRLVVRTIQAMRRARFGIQLVGQLCCGRIDGRGRLSGPSCTPATIPITLSGGSSKSGLAPADVIRSLNGSPGGHPGFTIAH
jgi:hypothetical protein